MVMNISDLNEFQPFYTSITSYIWGSHSLLRSSLPACKSN